jgi:tetratricopeptide (TPR) repeat protein
MRKAEIERARRKPAEHMGAYDLYLQALPHIYAIRPDENMQALGLLERAIALDGNYAPALAHAGWCLVQRTTRAWPPYSGDDLGQAVSWARQALAAGSDDAKAVVLGGFVLVMLRQDYAAGMDAMSRAVAMNPGSGFVNGIAGSGLTFGGDTERGRAFINRAIDLCPKDPSMFSFLTVAAVGELFLGNAESAIALARRSLALNPLWDSTHWVLVTAHTALGQTDEARAIAAKLLEVYPEATASNYERVLPMRSPEARRMVIDSLREAGLPA